MPGTFLAHVLRTLAAVTIAGAALSLSGCQNFFVCDKASCPASGSGSSGSGVDFLYVANSTTGSTYLNGYSLSSGTLTAISGFPTNLDFVPSSLTITPSDTFLYAGVSSTSSASAGEIYGYTIGSSGGLSILNSGTYLAVPTTGVSSLDVSPDGNYLFALDALGVNLYEYQINTSTGGLAFVSSFPLTSTGTITPESVRVSPNGNFVVCALGTGGDMIFPYSSSTGIPSGYNYATIPTGSTLAGDYAIAIDTNNDLYIARTTGVAVYSVSLASSNTLNSPAAISQTGLTYGGGPHAIALNSSSGGDVYVGNLTDSTVSGYTSSSGVLANVSGSPFTGPTTVAALGHDSSGKYIVAAGYNTSTGVQLFSIGSSGALSLLGSAGTGSSAGVPTAMALTH